jgi:6-phosphogluconolactonase (cycloisomerase 2 family)
MWWRAALVLFSAVVEVSSLFATTTPVLTMTSPVFLQSNGNPNTGNYYGDTPIHIVASATSPGCVGGIAAMVIYTADNYIAYETYSSYIDVQLALTPAYYNTWVKAFDNCGGVGFVVLFSYVQSSTGTVVVNSPEANLTYSSPVYFYASATTQCSKGVAAMGIYTANHQLAYSVNSSTLKTTLKLAPGTYNLAIQEWDNCGGAVNTLETITVAPQGISNSPEFVYIPRTGSPWIDGFWVSPASCALNTTPGSPFPAHYQPYGTAGDPLGVYVFAANQDSQDVNVYQIDHDNGGLTQTVESPVQVPQYGNLHPTAIIVDAKGRFVYVANGNFGLSGEIAGFKLDRNSGKLTLIPGSPFKMKDSVYGPVWGRYLTVEQTGNYLYTSDGGSANAFAGSVSGFSIDQNTGALTELVNSPFTANGPKGTPAGPEDIIVDPGNKHVYTANSESSISGWTIDASNGELTELPGSPWTDPTLDQHALYSPASIAIDAQDNYLFGLDSGGEQISIWSVDASTGAVTFQRDEHNGQITPDPQDKMRVVPGSSCMVTSGADAIAFDPSTGVTTIVPGSPFPLPGMAPEPGIAIAP